MTRGRPEAHDETDPPGAVSNQNGEEAQSGHRPDGTHPEPRTAGESKSGGREPAVEDGAREGRGGAGEGSQSTGDPNSSG